MHIKGIIQSIILLVITFIITLYSYRLGDTGLNKQDASLVLNKQDYIEYKSNEILDIYSDKDGIIHINYKDDYYCVIFIRHKDKENNYKYIIDSKDTYIINLTEGIGTYIIESYSVKLNSTNNEEILNIGEYIELEVENTEKVFKASTSLVNYTDNYDIINEIFSETSDIDEIYYYFSNMTYDYNLSNEIKNGSINTYKVNISDTLINKRGICLDIATSMAAVLRLKGYETKLLYGYTPKGEYHSWISVKIDNEWIQLDPTLNVTSYENNMNNYKIVEYH